MKRKGHQNRKLKRPADSRFFHAVQHVHECRGYCWQYQQGNPHWGAGQQRHNGTGCDATQNQQRDENRPELLVERLVNRNRKFFDFADLAR